MRHRRREPSTAARTGRRLIVAQPFRLRPVLELAQRRLESATTQLQALALKREEAQGRLDQLRGFLETYRTDYQSAMESGVDLVRLRDFQAFLGKLERAIELQGGEVARCQAAWEAEHRNWMALRTKEQAFTVLERRHDAQETLLEGRREQKQLDEFSLRKGPKSRHEY